MCSPDVEEFLNNISLGRIGGARKTFVITNFRLGELLQF